MIIMKQQCALMHSKLQFLRMQWFLIHNWYNWKFSIVGFHKCKSFESVWPFFLHRFQISSCLFIVSCSLCLSCSSLLRIAFVTWSWQSLLAFINHWQHSGDEPLSINILEYIFVTANISLPMLIIYNGFCGWCMYMLDGCNMKCVNEDDE